MIRLYEYTLGLGSAKQAFLSIAAMFCIFFSVLFLTWWRGGGQKEGYTCYFCENHMWICLSDFNIDFQFTFFGLHNHPMIFIDIHISLKKHRPILLKFHTFYDNFLKILTIYGLFFCLWWKPPSSIPKFTKKQARKCRPKPSVTFCHFATKLTVFWILSWSGISLSPKP